MLHAAPFKDIMIKDLHEKESRIEDKLMRFIPLTVTLERTELEEEFANIAEKKNVSLGENCIFIKRFMRRLYLPYEQIVWAFRRVETVNGKAGKNQTTFEVQHLVMVTPDKKQFDVLVESKEAANHILERIQEKNPAAEIAFSKEKKEKFLGTD